jgi:hypothetical protein
MVADVPDISKYFGQDSTPGGMQWHFRAIKDFAKRQKACADAGGDPQTLGIGQGGGRGSSTLLSTFHSLIPYCTAQHSTSTSMSVANVKLTELQRLHAFLQMILLHMRFNIDSDRSRRTLQICWLLQMQMDLARPSYVVSFCSATLFFATFEHNGTALLL